MPRFNDNPNQSILSIFAHSNNLYFLVVIKYEEHDYIVKKFKIIERCLDLMITLINLFYLYLPILIIYIF